MNGPGESWLAPERLAKIDDIEFQERGRLCCDDRRVALLAGQQNELSEEFPRTEMNRLRQAYLNLARSNKIHGVARLAPPRGLHALRGSFAEPRIRL
jgi:hypothetical protein